MKNATKRFLTLLLALAMVCSLAACGGSSSGGSTSDTGSGDSSAASTGDASTGAATSDVNNDADGNGRADKVVYASTQAYSSLTPFLNPKTYTAAVFETLGRYHDYGSDFEGLLMESWEQTDELTYVAYLYDNIYDSEGNHITASDVVFSFETVRTEGEISQTDVIAEITALDDYTVQFTWADTPVTGAFEQMMSLVNIVSQEAYEASGDGMASSPVGTGPYVVTSWTSGVSMTLEVNENYWASEEQVKFDTQKQNADVIEIQTISETSQISMALQTGEIDMTEDLAATDASSFEEGGAYSDSYSVLEQADYAPKSILVNVSEDAKTSDYYLRQAIMCAIDNEYIASVVNGGSNQAVYGLGAPSNSDYDEEAWKSYLPERSVEQAKEYLAQSAYPDGTTITLLLIDGGINNDIAEIIQNQLTQIGIEVDVQAQTFGNWLTNKGDSTTWDLIISELSSTNCCAAIYQNAFDTRDGSSNEIFSTDATLQELLEACIFVDNHTQESVNAFQQYLTEQAYVIPGLVQINYNVYDSTLISEIVYSGEGAVLPQAFTYIGVAE
ncbi:MAG: ABC transporter substrate-binding protein [Clostridiales bacterium]|nr:ABC transporter substrate-binding protein [Clostridiales bacterium]